ncbi:MAG: hypothetical protein ABR572_01250 [Cryomorphaceae bacterium]
MKKILYVVLFFILAGIVSFLIVNRPLPEGEPGPRAEALADEILTSINIEAWEAIPYVGWSFRGTNHYVWDKVNHIALVKWNDASVVLDLNTLDGHAEEGGVTLSGKDAEAAIRYAYTNWCNDSFWLNAPAKIRDGGTERSLVTLDDGTEALLVQYSSGGVTPGDAYLWVRGDDGLPAYYRMWVEIIPIGGIKATWENWAEYDGAMLASEHNIGPASVPVEDIKTGSDPADFGLSADYFTAWRN